MNYIEEIKDVLLNREELLKHGYNIGQKHILKKRKGSIKRLKKRLEENYNVIFDIYKKLDYISKDNIDVSPASEWLLDNFYKIEEQVKEVRRNIVQERFYKLNALSSGYLKGYPRIYAIALEYVSHTDGSIEEDLLIDFIKAYQSNQILSISEVWALSLMVRIALVENIRIICSTIYYTQLQWNKAEEDSKLKCYELLHAIDENLEVRNRLNASYIEHILALFRRAGIESGDAYNYLEKRLDEYNTAIKDVVQYEHREHAIRKISLGNSITSLHSISTMDWNEIFESISIVEDKLSKDPAGFYSSMDFESRDYYRRTVEDISKASGVSEIRIANAAINLGKAAIESGKPLKAAHVGYYLIDEGRKELFSQLKIRGGEFRLKSPCSYLVSIVSYTAMLIVTLNNILATNWNTRQIIGFSILLLIPASEVGVNLANYIFMKLYKPTMLPRLDYHEGIPKEAATMVIIPALLSDKSTAQELAEKMEVYYLANKDENIFFGLVGDFKDCEAETNPADEDIVDTAMAAIRNLNNKYKVEKTRFYYFHRKREFNAKQNKWMGWERKRGAIIHFNNLIQGNKSTSFIYKSSDIQNLKDIKYIITIDSDTNLIIDSARKLIGTITHPLNKAVYDSKLKIVKAGYGIIQPRIGIDMEDSNKTLFSKTFAGDGGIDPYATAVSDIYQDVFGEGIFTGKGIYDLKLFNKVVEEEVEDNSVLSHDLLEGSLLRAGLAGDIELIDGFPGKYSSYSMRQHRWVRGDWQLIKWIFSNNPLSLLSKWKMLDNLRRSMLQFSQYVLLLFGVIFLPVNPSNLLYIIISILLFPNILNLFSIFGRRVSFATQYYKPLRKVLYQLFIQLAFLPYNAYLMADAISRTLYRVFFSHKNMLEWVTAADADKKLKADLKGYVWRMRSAIALSILFAAAVVLSKEQYDIALVLLTALWITSPYIAFRISSDTKKEKSVLSGEDRDNLDRIGRKTWSYYEELVCHEFNYLPPDNYQEYPLKGAVPRTSPTNIGLYMVSTLAAKDLGYITTDQMSERLRNTLDTIEKLENWKGHLYNWYDIKTLEVLRPHYVSTVDSGNFISYMLLLSQGLREHIDRNDKKSLFEDMIERIDYIIKKTEFIHLYDKKKNLFSIGYDIENEHLTNSYYDLLASEARTTSFLAAARREVPSKHWSKLGRALTCIYNARVLVSWTGTMFEYFMPSLIMKNYDNTVLDETYKGVIKAQKSYGYKNIVPWGTSESGYYAFDLDLNYQYKAFGVPDLGLKRGLIEEVVISPYSTIMAVNFDPKAAAANLRKLIKIGMEGKYGLYEAVDFTPKRMPIGTDYQIIKSYMAHHQGMNLLAINNYLNDDIMINRFHSNPIVKVGEIMLQERIPRNIFITKEYKESIAERNRHKRLYEEGVRSYNTSDILPPPCQILTNGCYSVLLNNRGGGYSKLGGTLINRWRNDALNGGYGSYVFIRDVNKDKVWSATYEPINEDAYGYSVSFYQSRAEFTRVDNEVKTMMQVFVSPEDNVELRKVKIENHGKGPILLEITSYFEVVLTTEASDIAHRAFSNLFVRTEYLDEYNSLIAVRKPREANGQEIFAFHTSVVEGDVFENVEYETNRVNFIGRGRNIKNPMAVFQPLSNTSGIVLDPIMSIRRVMRIDSGSYGVISFVTGCGISREKVKELLIKYRENSSIQRAYELSIIRSQVERAYLNLESQDIINFERLIPHLVYNSPSKSKYKNYILKNKKGQSSLWVYGISGDLPILLISIADESNIPILKQAVKAHEFLKIKGLDVDLVILNLDERSYLQPLRNAILNLVEGSNRRHLIGKNGGIFIINASNISIEDREFLIAASALALKAEEDPIEKQIIEVIAKKHRRSKSNVINNEKMCKLTDVSNALFYNGYGGFSDDGSEYIMSLKKDCNTPAPWVNVIANPKFGSIISERGGGYTWALNSREYKLTPWTNDLATDEPQEIVYIEDIDKGFTWSITPKSSENAEPWVVKHGWGYTSFYKHCYGLEQELEIFVPMDEKLKVNILKLKNREPYKKSLKLSYFVNPVLGVSPKETNQHITTELNEYLNGLILRNGYNSDFSEKLVFISSTEHISDYKTNKLEFFDFMKENLNTDLSVGYEPCGEIQIEMSLEPDEGKIVCFYLGQGDNYDEIKDILEKYKVITHAEKELKRAKMTWKSITGKIKVETPDKSMDILLNGWLVYQTISCRLWARTGFYQSGGAYGFRDQLQDAVNVGMIMPDLLKEQILLHCSHQFEEGDVQHWWHPMAGNKGVRTRFSDDLLWLPYAVIEYIKLTEDKSIMAIEVSYIKNDLLKDGEDERYGIPQKSAIVGTVYEHCIKAINRSLRFGIHGLPLMGSGDWNDGMNLVGNKGEGESVWLAFFLYEILKGFVPLCKYIKDEARTRKYEENMGKLVNAIDNNGWDGKWYKRAYYDDGSPLGSSESIECMIDSIAQSWSVISGAGKPERASIAMDSVKRHLVKEDEGLILLFTPPFDKTDKNPGYIKSYVPGVRENGGQYTHAAAWVICAFAELGDGDTAQKFFHLINPINHTKTPLECAIYKTEPYAIAADVYTVRPHVGRGGWSWYTGAAGWLYKAGIEYILGVKRRGNKLCIDPCIPQDWEGYKVTYNHLDTIYEINVLNPENINRGVVSVTLDGKVIDTGAIKLYDDKARHEVVVLMGCKK